MAAAFLDAELAFILESYVVDNEKIAKKMFGQSCPLGAFSSRIDISYLLGLIDSVTHRDLHLIRKIRNDFGHIHLPITFDDHSVSARCRELNQHFRESNLGARKIFVSSAIGALVVIHTALNNKQGISERDPIDFEDAKESTNQFMGILKAAVETSNEAPNKNI